MGKLGKKLKKGLVAGVRSAAQLIADKEAKEEKETRTTFDDNTTGRYGKSIDA
jgi:hypothetical protein